MLIPFDMLAVMLFLGWYAETPVADPPPLSYGLAAFGLAVVVLYAIALALNRRAVAALSRPGNSLSSRRGIAGQAEVLFRLALVAVHVGFLYETALPWSLARALGIDTDSGFWIQLFGLLPFLALFFVGWLPLFKTHRMVRYGSWTRRSFLLNKARYNLYMVLIWLPFAWLADNLAGYAAALPILFVAAAWAFPAVIARFWGCVPLPEGEIMDMVRCMETAAGTKFSKVFLWEPEGNLMTAAALGLAPPFRYLFLTRALVDGLAPDELEAVILHELGHVKKRHLLFYLFVTLGGINAAVLAAALAPLESSAGQFVLTAALVLLYFRFVFGWLSRNMERQADLFAMEKSGSPRSIVNALEKLGIAAGNMRMAASWHHYGIAERTDFLRRAGRRPELARRHHAGVASIMLGGCLAVVVVIGFLAWIIAGELGQRAAVSPFVAGAAERAHWRRVVNLMPGDVNASLELAQRLAGLANSREEAEALAVEARRMALDAGDRQAGEAADKLLRELRTP